MLQFDVVTAKSKLSIIEQIRLEKQKFGEQIKAIYRGKNDKKKIDLNKEILRRTSRSKKVVL